MLIAVAAALAVPTVDLPGTAFDETNTPINETVVPTQAAPLEGISLSAASAVWPPARTHKTGVLKIRTVGPARLSDLSQLRELLCSLLC